MADRTNSPEKKLIAEKIIEEIIGAAIEVHRNLGPGLLESAYSSCLAQEFYLRGVEFEKEKPISITYKGGFVDCGFRADFIVLNQVIVELKTVEQILPIHEAQLLTYLKLTGLKVGLLANFHSLLIKNGIKRLVPLMQIFFVFLRVLRVLRGSPGFGSPHFSSIC